MRSLFLCACITGLSLAASAAPHLAAATGTLHHANEAGTANLAQTNTDSTPTPSFNVFADNEPTPNPASQSALFEDEGTPSPALPAPLPADDLADKAFTGNIQPIAPCDTSSTDDCPTAASTETSVSEKIDLDAYEFPVLLGLGVGFLGAATTVVGRRPLI